MPEQSIQKKRWNLFARELEGILAKYNVSLSQLDERVGIQREKVRRLLQSLQTPNMYPILNIHEMELLQEKVELDPWDITHLQAAMLATSMQKTLMERAPQNDALQAAEQIFSVILIMLQKQSGRLRNSRGTRGGDGGPVKDHQDAAYFDDEWGLIDEAEMEMHLSYNVSMVPIRIAYVRSALAHFTDVQTRLYAADKHMQNFQHWRDCEAACQEGLAAANKRLQDLVK